MYKCDECQKKLDLSATDGHIFCSPCLRAKFRGSETPIGDVVPSMSAEEVQRRLFALIDEYAKRNLTPHYATEERRPESLGQMMSTAFNWDGNAIMLAAAEGLEDSNFHNEAAALRAKVTA